MDVSSYQPRNLTNLIHTHNVGHVVVRVYTRFESPPQQHTIDQIHSALDNGATVSGYVWLYNSISPTALVNNALDLLGQIAITIPILWIDCETYQGSNPTYNQIVEAVTAVQNSRQKAGIYSAKWWWGNLPGINVPLWAAQYDKNHNIDMFVPFGGWHTASGKQYTSSPVDLNTFRYEVTI